MLALAVHARSRRRRAPRSTTPSCAIPDSLAPAPARLEGPALLALAVRFEPTPGREGAGVRLIDNRVLRPQPAAGGPPVIRTMLKSKIHRATVTEANVEYEGSVTIDADLLRAADILPYEQVDIYDCTNGSRLTTYVIEGEPGSGEICVNGAAAHLIKPHDLVIICSYVQVDDAEARGLAGDPRLRRRPEPTRATEHKAIPSSAT